MEFEYVGKITDLIEQAVQKNEEVIKMLVQKFAENIENDKIIHTFGTGHSHMIGIELFGRAGGLGNVNAMLDPDTLTNFGAQRSCAMEKLSGVADIIYDNYKIEPGDIMVITSNSGRNSIPVEMAMRCQKEGIYCIALTNLKQSMATTSRHHSGKKLYECVDCVIDNCVPEGDATLTIGGIKTGPATSIVEMALMNTIAAEAIKLVVAHGKRPYVFQSQNVDGYDNDEIYRHFDGRIKHY